MLKAQHSEFLELLRRPGPGAPGRQRADLFHLRGIDRRRRVAPLAADVGQRCSDLFVGQGRAERRHQSGRSFLAAEHDAGGNVSGSESEVGTDEAWREVLAAAAVGLMSCRAERLVHLPARHEALLFLSGQWHDGRRAIWLTRPAEAGDYRSRSLTELTAIVPRHCDQRGLSR